MSLDNTLSSTVRTHILSFFINAFQSLDNGLIRKECAPLVSVGIWHNLATDAVREHKLAQNAQLRKAWRAAAKKYEASDEVTKSRLRFERGWLFSILMDFAARLREVNKGMSHNRYI